MFILKPLVPPPSPPGQGRTGRRLGVKAGVAAVLIVAAQAASAASTPRPDSRNAKLEFDRDVRPILAENCYACHGPDEGKRKAKLRRYRKDDALKPLKDGDFAIVPGDPSKSKMIERISSPDPDEVMPPVKTGKKLTAQQIER